MTTTHRIAITGPAPLRASARPGVLEELIESAHSEALDAARLAGQAEGHADALTQAAAALAQAVEALEMERESCAAELARASVELGIGIARRLVRTELAADQHDIEAIVREVLAATSEGRTSTRIHVSPADATRLADVPFRAATEVIADESVSTGSVRLATPQGVLVRDIDECMNTIAQRLTAEVSK
jgi:flagellar biosynthesis/type III secretory pathway protein FliH